MLRFWGNYEGVKICGGNVMKSITQKVVAQMLTLNFSKT